MALHPWRSQCDSTLTRGMKITPALIVNNNMWHTQGRNSSAVWWPAQVTDEPWLTPSLLFFCSHVLHSPQQHEILSLMDSSCNNYKLIPACLLIDLSVSDVLPPHWANPRTDDPSACDLIPLHHCHRQVYDTDWHQQQPCCNPTAPIKTQQTRLFPAELEQNNGFPRSSSSRHHSPSSCSYTFFRRKSILWGRKENVFAIFFIRWFSSYLL